MAVYDEKMNNKKTKMRVEEVRAVKVLGQGAIGTVVLAVRDGFMDNPFALKMINKDNKDQQWFKKSKAIEREREILSSLQHPFLPSLMGEVETDTMVGWAVEYCPGGDLHYLRHIQPDKTFSESAIRFYAAEVVLALEYLHSKRIVYRDLKPENILVQSSGHIMLTDFDLSTRLYPRQSQACVLDQQQQNHQSYKKQRRGWSVLASMLTSKPKEACPSSQGNVRQTACGLSRSNSFVGTDEYVAPEIVRGDGHDFLVDWWSLGILLYEMFYGKTPFKGGNSKETYARILSMRPRLVGPPISLHDLIMRLLEKDPQRRLGFSKGASDIKSHDFFRGVDWDSIHSVCRPPVVPDNDITSFCTDDIFTVGNFVTSDLQTFIEAINSGSECEETSESDIDGLF